MSGQSLQRLAAFFAAKGGQKVFCPSISGICALRIRQKQYNSIYLSNYDTKEKLS